MEFECKSDMENDKVSHIPNYQSELLINLTNLKASGFNILTSIIATDYKDCIELNYRLYSTFQTRFFDYKIYVQSEADSVVSVYPSALFDEREIYDLFGVTFNGNPALNRILTPETWKGHPLRKDYKLEDERLVWND